MTDEKLQALARGTDASAFTPEERAVVRLADAMTTTPADVPAGLFDELREIFGDAAVVELASALAWENHRARFNRVFDVGSEGYSEGAFCPLPLPSEAG